MPRATTRTSRLACARHAVSELLTWEHPGEPVDWSPSEEQIEAKTTALYSWVTLAPGENGEPSEAAEALAQVLASRAERAAA